MNEADASYEDLESIFTVDEETTIVKEEAPIKDAEPQKEVQSQVILFARYFTSLGRPMHHKAGMEAFINTKGKKTREAWDSLFAQY